jgi:hypothetical protein
MRYLDFIWTDETVAHIAEHGISRDGRYIIAVYEVVDPMTILPVTAYEVPGPK